jgi:hypothetical protein
MAWTDYPGIRHLTHLWNRLKSSVAQDVPDRIARCEFDCAKPDCSPEAIRDCERRIDYEAAEKGVEHDVAQPDEHPLRRSGTPTG